MCHVHLRRVLQDDVDSRETLKRTIGSGACRKVAGHVRRLAGIDNPTRILGRRDRTRLYCGRKPFRAATRNCARSFANSAAISTWLPRRLTAGLTSLGACAA
jgi:hypothetical protein